MVPKLIQTVYSEGIFHGLPTFPDHDGKKYTAIVTGATGISGSEILSVLAAAPERWETVYAMSRRAPTITGPTVKHVAADFLHTPEQLAELFKTSGIEKVDYIFFTSYLQPPAPEGAGIWSNTEELETVNVTLLSNFLSALSISTLIPKRFLLQTGGKHYALHLGPTTIPMDEGTVASRVPHTNFYFPQEDILAEWSTKHSTTWTVSRPGFIIGANPAAQINISYGLALFASVQRELGLPLSYPSDVQSWDINKDLSTAKLIGYFSEWAVLAPGTANETFNIVDDSPFSYGAFWPTLAKWYGLEYGIPDQDESKYVAIALPNSPPPRGFGKPGVVQIAFSFEEWAKKPEVKEAWGKIQEREGLDKKFDPWGPKGAAREVFSTLDAELLGGWARTETMDKAKTLGWHGHVKTVDGIRDTLDKMVELKMVPRV